MCYFFDRFGFKGELIQKEEEGEFSFYPPDKEGGVGWRNGESLEHQPLWHDGQPDGNPHGVRCRHNECATLGISQLQTRWKKDPNTDRTQPTTTAHEE